MDQNRIPSSSPLQHHNESCGRPTSSSSSTDPNAPSSSTAFPRPSATSHQNPPTQSNGLSWSHDSHAEGSGSTAWSSSSSSWTEDDGSAKAGPSIASSSRLPSTNFFPVAEETMSEIPDSDIARTYTEAPGSALLTSEPLNRSVSTHPSPLLPDTPSITPSPSPLLSAGILATGAGSTAAAIGKRRNRASSLPTAEPVFKRRRFAADVPTPSEEVARTFATRRRDASKLSAQQARAKELGERLLAGRNLRGGCRPGEQIIVASHQPPINIKTLRSLDAHEILKQPQLRHDLLFDTLAFRPINSSSATYSDTIMSGTELAASLPPGASADGPVSYSRGVCTVTDMYWESVEMEITTGCRCTRWQVPTGMTLDAKGIKGKERMTECVCGKWRSDMSETEWWAFQKSRMWKSRLPELIKALREILISLMGSTTPCPNHFAHSFSREALDLHELTCPTVTHALVPQLYEALDPEFLTRRVRRNAFDVSLFEMLGEAMKVHCAPIRDGLVDDMVKTAMGTGGGRVNVAMGLRKCFDCVEIMKLDIANHQVHALRPYLWSCATQYELSAFQSHLTKNSTPIASSSTRDWMRTSSLRVLSRAAPQERLHLVGNCPCRLGDNTELVLRSAADGFAAIVFGDQGWKGGKDGKDSRERWLTFLNPKSGMAVEACSADSVPESLRMDVRRISAFHAEAVELTIIHLLILACRDLLPSIHPNLTLKATRKILGDFSDDLDLILAAHPVCGGDSDSEVALQLAARIIRIKREDTALPFTEAEHVTLARLSETLSRYITTHIRPDSALFGHSFRRLEEVVRVMLTHEVLKLEGEMTVVGAGTGAGVPVCEAIRSGKDRIGVSEEDDEEPMEEDEQEEEEEEAEDDLTSSTASTEEAIDVDTGADSTASVPPKRMDSVQNRIRSREIRDQQRAEELRLARLYGLDVVFGDLKGLAKRMEKIVGFNVGVFKTVYGESGMVVGA